MKYVHFLFLAVLFVCSPALAQWQTPDNSVPIGRGVGNTGFDYAAPGTLGFPLKSNGPLALPSFGAIVNGAITPGAANTVKGSLDGISTVDIPLPSCAADGRHAITYTSGTGWACTATANSFTAVTPKAATVTMTVGSPGIVGWTAHALPDNAVVYFCTTGSLLTGLTACVPAAGTVSANTYASNPTLYYVMPGSQTTDAFNVSLTQGGPPVVFSGAQAGTHTGFANAMACAGCPGEMIWATRELATGSALPAVDSSPGQVINSIPLTAGIWEVWGSGGIIKINAATPTMQHLHSSLVYGFSTIATAPYNGTTAAHVNSNDPNGWLFTNLPEIVPLYSPTTDNQVATSNFTPTTANTAGLYGTVRARRIR